MDAERARERKALAGDLADHVVFQCAGGYLAERCPSTPIFTTVVDDGLSNLLDSSVVGVFVPETTSSRDIDDVFVRVIGERELDDEVDG